MGKKSKNTNKNRKSNNSKTSLSKAQKKEVKKIANKEANKHVDIQHYDHKFIGSQGGTYFILPWGVDSDLLKGNVCGDALPVNQLDNIHRLDTNNPGPLTDSYRIGDQIFLKHIAVKLRILAPIFTPGGGQPAIKQGPQTASKIRLMVIEDSEGNQSLDPASVNSGVLGSMYSDIGHCTSLVRSLPTFKAYQSDSRFKVLTTKTYNLNANKPFIDVDFSVKVNKKINYVPASRFCMTGIYLFAMSDYPASTGSITQDPPRVESFWLRYYYTDA